MFVRQQGGGREHLSSGSAYSVCFVWLLRASFCRQHDFGYSSRSFKTSPQAPRESTARQPPTSQPDSFVRQYGGRESGSIPTFLSVSAAAKLWWWFDIPPVMLSNDWVGLFKIQRKARSYIWNGHSEFSLWFDNTAG